MEAGSKVYAIVTQENNRGSLSHLEESLKGEGFVLEPSFLDIKPGSKDFVNIYTSQRHRVGFITKRAGDEHYSLIVRGVVCPYDDAKEKLGEFCEKYIPVPAAVVIGS